MSRRKNQERRERSNPQMGTMMTRRTFLAASACTAAALVIPSLSLARPRQTLNFYHTHTGERLNIDYSPENYDGSIRHALEYFLRDFRTGEMHSIDSRLFDTLCAIQTCCNKQTDFHIISGYRSPKTNAFLRQNSSGVAKKSLHMEGRALDIRMSGLPTRMLRDIAINLHDGGVGYYSGSNFVHIDTGRKRSW